MASIRNLEFISLLGNDYDVYIDDADYGGSVISSTIGSGGFTLSYPIQSSTSPRETVVFPSKVKVPFKIQNAADQAIITDMIGAEENRYKIRIDRNGSLFWSGFILTDSISWSDEPYPREFSIQAIDGIGRLKDIPYNNSGVTYTGRETILEHIYNCLGKIPLNYFYDDAADNFLKVIVNWYEDAHVVVSTLDPLTVTDVDHTVFWKRGETNDLKYKSCFDVLKYCLQLFGARLYQSDGVWRIEQFNERENATFTEFIYSYDQTHLSTDTGASYEATAVGTGQTLPRRLSSGRFTYYQPLDQVTIIYNHNGAENLLEGTEWNYSLVGGLDNQGDTILGNLDLDNNNESLLISGKINFKVHWIVPSEQPTYRHEFRMKIQVGNYYLKREILNQGNLFAYGNTIWTTNESWYHISTGNLFQAGTNPNDITIIGSIPISFTTPVLPEAGDIIFDFFWYQCVGTNYQVYGTVLPNSVFVINYDYIEPSLRLVQDGEQVNMETSRKYYSTNDTSGNTSQVNLETVLADGPFSTTFSKLKVYNGSSWVEANQWRVNDTGTAYLIQDLICRQILSGQKTSIEKYTGQIRGNIYAHTRILIDSTYYICDGITFNSDMDEWQGTWFEIAVDDTGVTTEPSEGEGPTQEPYDFPVGLGTGGGGPVQETNTQTQAPTQTTAPTGTGFVEFIEVVNAGVLNLQEGDQLSIVNTATGMNDTVTVVQSPVEGDTYISVEGYILNDYPTGSYIIPDAAENTTQNQVSGEVINEFFVDGTIDKDYYFTTDALIPRYERFRPVYRTTPLFIAPTEWFWVVGPELNGREITEIFMAVAVAGTTGNTVIDTKKNGTTFHTSTISSGSTYVNDILSTAESLSTGDLITVEITGAATTKAKGLYFQPKIEEVLSIYTGKLTYQKNRTGVAGLLIWQKGNYNPKVPIGVGSAAFSTGLEIIDCGTDSSLDITAEFTISIWAKIESFAGNQALIQKWSGTLGYAIRYNAAGSIDFKIDATTVATFSDTNITLGKWHHYTGTYDGTTAKLYLDGELIDSSAASAPSSTVNSFLMNVYGNLAAGKLYGRALTDTEVAKNMLVISSIDLELDLISLWKLSDNDGTTAPDSFGDNDGTIS